MDCWVANAVAESELRLSSSKIVVTVEPELKLKEEMPLTVPPLISTVLSAVTDIGKVIQALSALFLIFKRLFVVSIHHS